VLASSEARARESCAERASDAQDTAPKRARAIARNPMPPCATRSFRHDPFSKRALKFFDEFTHW
jgi:hypothetical protein